MELQIPKESNPNSKALFSPSAELCWCDGSPHPFFRLSLSLFGAYITTSVPAQVLDSTQKPHCSVSLPFSLPNSPTMTYKTTSHAESPKLLWNSSPSQYGWGKLWMVPNWGSSRRPETGPLEALRQLRWCCLFWFCCYRHSRLNVPAYGYLWKVFATHSLSFLSRRWPEEPPWPWGPDGFCCKAWPPLAQSEFPQFVPNSSAVFFRVCCVWQIFLRCFLFIVVGLLYVLSLVGCMGMPLLLICDGPSSKSFYISVCMSVFVGQSSWSLEFKMEKFSSGTCQLRQPML